MIPEFTLHVDDIIRELNLGRATVNFMLERFARFLSRERVQGRTCYSPDALPTLIRIKDLMDQGLMPSQVEKSLESPPPPSETAGPPPVEDVRMSQDALAFIQNLFQDIKVHQNRIARAHEKRAEAEERKAVAIEKRAEAEAKKAEAMNNIATALQEMSRHRPVEPQALEIAGQAAHALTLNDTPDLELDSAPESISEEPAVDLGSGLDDTDLDDLFSPLESDKELRGEPDLADLSPEDLDLDDLTIEMPEPDSLPQDLDDLTQLMDEVSTPDESEEQIPGDEPDGVELTGIDLTGDDLEDLLNDPAPLPDFDDLDRLLEEEPAAEAQEIDDLSLLVDAPPPGNPLETDMSPGRDLDDLYALVDSHDFQAREDQDQKDQNQAAQDLDLDNLYDLVDVPEKEPPVSPPSDALDNLSLLVDPLSAPLPPDLDDLSALLDGPAGPPADMDDLSLLVTTDEKPIGEKATVQHREMDDLSALISEEDGNAPAEPPDPPSLKPDITPDQDMAKYKAAVMKIIIDLKNQGHSPAETTERLNKDEVLTLSGKPLWREKAIVKIYGFIDSAQ